MSEPEEFDPSIQDSYFSVMSIVEQVLLDLDMSVAHFSNKFLSWALRGLIDLKLDCSNEIKRILLPITDVQTCSLPVDYIDWITIGAIRGQYFVKFGTEDSLVGLPRTTATWNPSQRLPPGWKPNGVSFAEYSPFLTFNNGGRALPAFGGGLPQTGQFKIANGQIMLDAGLGITEIYLEYLGLGISICGETILHPYYAEYVRALLHFNHVSFGKRLDRSEAEITRLGRLLWHQEQKVRGRVFAITPTDFSKIARRSYRLTNHA